jgi:hypothetical protein
MRTRGGEGERFFKGRVQENRRVKGCGKGAPVRETMSSISSVRYARVSFTSFSFSSSYLEDQDLLINILQHVLNAILLRTQLSQLSV